MPQRLVILFAIILPSWVQAADELPPIYVTATRTAPVTEALPVSVTVLTAEDIAQSPARTLPELLRFEAGIQGRDLFGNYGARTTVDLRGFGATGAQNTLILLDGRRLNDIDLAPVDFAAIPLETIERVEMLRGSGAVLYGDGAVGGTINLITREALQEGVAGNAEVTAGSFDTVKAGGRIGTRTGPWALDATALRIESAGYRDNNRLEQTDAQASLRYLADEAQYYLKLGADDQDLRLPGARTVDPTLGLNELADDRRGTSTPDDFANQRGYFITLGAQHPLGAGDLTLDGGVRSKSQEALLNFGEGATSFVDTRLNTYSITPRFQLDHTALGAQGHAVLGVDIYDAHYDSQRAQAKGAPSIHDLKVEQSTVALYGQNTHAVTERLDVTLGLRLLHTALNARDAFDPSAPGGAFGSEAKDLNRDDDEVMAEAGVRWRLTEASSVFTRVTRSARIATVDELFEFDETFAQVFSPLKPQTGVLGEVGLDYTRARFSASAATYYGEFENEIAFDPETFSNINLNPTRRYGLELSTRVEPLAPLALLARYTLTQAEFDKGSFAGNTVPLVPVHMAEAGLRWTVTPGLALSANARYVGEKRFDNDQDNTFSKIPGYTFIDAQGQLRLSGWRLTAGVYNLTDEQAFDYGARSTFTPGRYSAYPLPTRNVLVTVGRDF